MNLFFLWPELGSKNNRMQHSLTQTTVAVLEEKGFASLMCMCGQALAGAFSVFPHPQPNAAASKL